MSEDELRDAVSAAGERLAEADAARAAAMDQVRDAVRAATGAVPIREPRAPRGRHARDYLPAAR